MLIDRGPPGRFLFNRNEKGSHGCFLADKGIGILGVDSVWEGECVGQTHVLFWDATLCFMVAYGQFSARN
jgi:hypothetical protein